MRQHKYRYWYNEKMLEVGSIQFFTDGTYIINDELSGGELLEATGLKDKNGREIYEGDIVEKKVVFIKRSIVRKGIERIEDNERYSDNLLSGLFLEEIYQYGNCSDGSPYSSKSSDYKHIDDLEDCVVIGNIYENPELLRNNL